MVITPGSVCPISCEIGLLLIKCQISKIGYIFQNEDDGVILSSLVWGQGRETEVGLLILDASTFEEIGRATFVTPGPVPKCLHGWFSFDV